MRGGVSILPATIDLAALAVKPEEGGTRGLASAIRGARYDYVLVDTPTGLGGFTLSALHLADAVLIPVQTEFLSLEGLVQVMRVLSILSKRGRGPGVLGILPTMYDARTKSSRDALRDIRTHFGSYMNPSLVKQILEYLAESSFQVVLTTHSIDVILELVEVEPEDSQLLQFEKDGRDVLHHRTLCLDEIKDLLDSNQDPRKLATAVGI